MNLWSTFVEGFEAVAQPCTLPLLVTAAVFALAAGRAAPLAVGSFVGALALVAWARFARIVTLDVVGWTGVAMGACVMFAVVLVALNRNRNTLAVMIGSALGGFVAAVAWRPCVGTNLANIINDASDAPLRTLTSTVAYILGVAAIPFAIALVPVGFPRTAAFFGQTRLVGLGVLLGVALGALMAAGLWDSVVEELLSRSTA